MSGTECRAIQRIINSRHVVDTAVLYARYQGGALTGNTQSLERANVPSRTSATRVGKCTTPSCANVTLFTSKKVIESSSARTTKVESAVFAWDLRFTPDDLAGKLCNAPAPQGLGHARICAIRIDAYEVADRVLTISSVCRYFRVPRLEREYETMLPGSAQPDIAPVFAQCIVSW